MPGWEIAAFYRPVIQVGGDIYGWLRMRDRRMLFWIADATGHGASAALLTTLAKLLFHHGNAENETPTEIMRAVDRDFRSIFGARSFMTAMCVALDPQSGAGSMWAQAIRRCWWHDTTEKRNPSRRPRRHSGWLLGPALAKHQCD